MFAVDVVTDVPVIPVMYPQDCCPTSWRCKYACWEAVLRTAAGRRWWTLRCFANKLVDHKWFETFIIVMIIGSSVSLVSTSMIVIGPPFVFCVLRPRNVD